jgi:hypothetical protein
VSVLGLDLSVGRPEKLCFRSGFVTIDRLFLTIDRLLDGGIVD